MIIQQVDGKPNQNVKIEHVDVKSIPLVLQDGRTYEELKKELTPE